jgi:hypothetical protein
MHRRITETPVSDDALHLLRTLARPDPPPWLRDRILTRVYAMERRKRLLRSAARYGAVGVAVLLWGAGTVCLSWAITH